VKQVKIHPSRGVGHAQSVPTDKEGSSAESPCTQRRLIPLSPLALIFWWRKKINDEMPC